MSWSSSSKTARPNTSTTSNLAEWTEANLEAQSNRSTEGYEIQEDRWIDEKTHRINKTTQVFNDGKTLSRSGESVKLYTPEEMTSLLEQGGLIVEDIYGDYVETNYTPASPRMIVVGRKA